MKKVLLSVALATYNEEKNIVDCLNSLEKVADEIVVVDGQSQDRTAEIAKDFGAKVITVENKAMFHINKNLAMDKCLGEWILLVDADEIISSELAKEIRLTISQNPQTSGYWINRRNWFLGDFLEKGGAYPDQVIRLFRKGKGRLPEITVHEQVKIDGKVGYLKNDILHFADPTFERYLKRANRYSDETSKLFKEKKLSLNPFSVAWYLIFKPVVIFLKIYFRHSGYKDGFRGFVWAFFSASHYYYAYSKYLTEKR